MALDPTSPVQGLADGRAAILAEQKTGGLAKADVVVIATAEDGDLARPAGTRERPLIVQQPIDQLQTVPVSATAVGTFGPVIDTSALGIINLVVKTADSSSRVECMASANADMSDPFKVQIVAINDAGVRSLSTTIAPFPGVIYQPRIIAPYMRFQLTALSAGSVVGWIMSRTRGTNLFEVEPAPAA